VSGVGGVEVVVGGGGGGFAGDAFGDSCGFGCFGGFYLLLLRLRCGTCWLLGVSDGVSDGVGGGVGGICGLEGFAPAHNPHP